MLLRESISRRRIFRAGALAAAATFSTGAANVRVVRPSTASSNRLVIENLLASGAIVQLVDGVYILDGSLLLPEGSTLLGRAGSKLLLDESVCPSVNAVVKMSNRSTIRGVELDGNLLARERMGVGGYVFGVIINDSSHCLVQDCRAVGCGATDALFRDFGGMGGGYLISSDKRDAIGNVVRDCVSCGPHVGFHARIRTNFRGVQGGGVASRNAIIGLLGYGGNKNSIELVGPNTRYNSVSNCVIHNPGGQGGIEADFGASDNLFESCSIVLDFSHPLTRDLDCYSQRTMPKFGVIYSPEGNVFHKCKVSGFVDLNGHLLRGFVCYGSGRNASFIDPVIDISVKNNVGDVIGYFEFPYYAEIDGTKIVNMRFSKGITPKVVECYSALLR
jgi:hypothetical protein